MQWSQRNYSRVDLVDCPSECQPGTLASRQRGALVTKPCPVTSWQRFHVHVQPTCFQYPIVPVLFQLQQHGNDRFGQEALNITCNRVLQCIQ